MLHPFVVLAGLRLRRLLAGFMALALCMGLAPLAQGAVDDKVAAKAHYEAATRLYDVHEYGDALREYKAGYLTRPDPSFLFNIGQCYKKLGMPEQAREFFREYLKKAPSDDPNRSQAESRIRELTNLENAKAEKPAANTAAPHTAQTAPEVLEGGKSATTAPSEQSPGLPFSAAPAISLGTDPAGVDLSATALGQPDRAAPAYYKTWWFWTGVSAVVVAGTVTAVLLSRGGGGGSPNVPGTTLGTRTVLQ
jgi:tetratricopeptide (TPR) repeat protein